MGFYRELWCLDDESLEAAGSFYAGIIRGFRGDLATEIESIARAARQPAWQLFALNSRSEIFNGSRIAQQLPQAEDLPAECTVVLDGPRKLLAQNWDWSRFLVDRVLDLSIECSNGTRIRTLTEPGIIAKVGMNHHGLGACLNILAVRQRLSGVPVHVLLRALLECQNLEQAQTVVAENSTGKASHVLLADDKGQGLSVEFAGEDSRILQAEKGMYLHTNHYLSNDMPNGVEVFTSSRPRLAAGIRQRDSGNPDWVKRLLLEQADGENSVCQPWAQAGIRGFGEVGTVFTVLMDLPDRRMHIRPGADPAQAFYSVSV